MSSLEASVVLHFDAPSVIWEDMNSHRKHWMVTLQQVFSPLFAAMGIPSEWCTCRTKSCLVLLHLIGWRLGTGTMLILLTFCEATHLLTCVLLSANTITFLIIWRKNCMLSMSSTFYLMAISVADNLLLIFNVVHDLSLKCHHQEPYWSYEPWCNWRANLMEPNPWTWLVVLFPMEHFISMKSQNETLHAKMCNLDSNSHFWL